MKRKNSLAFQREGFIARSIDTTIRNLTFNPMQDADARQKLSQTRLGLNLKGDKNPMFGHRHSPTTIELMKVARARNNEIYKTFMTNNNPSRREDIKIKIRAFRMTQKLPTRNTSIEKSLFKELNNRHIFFEAHKTIIGRTQPDVFIKPNLCVFADGEYWHERKEVKERDAKIDDALIKSRYRILRFSGVEIKSNVVGCVDEIEDNMERR